MTLTDYTKSRQETVRLHRLLQRLKFDEKLGDTHPIVRNVRADIEKEYSKQYRFERRGR